MLVRSGASVCVCVCVCVCVYVCVYVRVYALRIVSRDKILRLKKKTLSIIINLRVYLTHPSVIALTLGSKYEFKHTPT